MIACAGGREKARFVVFPTASKSDRSAFEFRAILASQGVPLEQISIIDLMPENAEIQAAKPEVVEKIRRATAAFFTGGDQVRIVQALRKRDRTPTPALVAIEEMWHGGGVIAGSSAGAAMQSARMLSVAGLPDESLDQGMDCLDFGIRSNIRQRGLLVTHGLGFFQGGIVDQHFSQYRGRLGRLSRALMHERVRFGFGIDENTAIAVSSDGRIEVLGAGSVTIIDAADVSCAEDALGCHLSGLKLTYLQTGDRFDPVTGAATIRAEKKLIEEGTQDYNGNHLITDIDAPAAVQWAIRSGLAENTSRVQEGVTLRYNRNFGHGYRYKFTKTERTKTYGGYADHLYSYAVVELQWEVHPILGNLQSPQTGLPVDLPSAAAAIPLQALWFRGILLADDQRRLRPDEALTRLELANAIVQTVHLTSPRGTSPPILDVSNAAAEFDDVVQVVAAGLMKLDKAGRFRPKTAVTREEAAVSLKGLAKLCAMDPPKAGATPLKDEADIASAIREAVNEVLQAGLMRLDDGHFRPSATFTRQEAATAFCRVIGFSWSGSLEAERKEGTD
jgi:cyanophycinase